ncbi:MAG TPA: hypothetical protein VMT16_16460, partial [Thermoanaerobaculia bacterium]|nr:hypothetical protein [Thermoanaerobaculia bacterium]
AWQRIGIGNFRSADGNPIPNVTVSGSCDPLKGKSPANTDACKITFDDPGAGQTATVKFDVLLYTQEGDTTPALVVDPVFVIMG